MINAAVGKSGPLMCSIKSEMVEFGSSINAKHAAITSLKLCGGMFVAIPTAIPDEPLINNVGIRVGNTDGSDSDSS